MHRFLANIEKNCSGSTNVMTDIAKIFQTFLQISFLSKPQGTLIAFVDSLTFSRGHLDPEVGELKEKLLVACCPTQLTIRLLPVPNGNDHPFCLYTLSKPNLHWRLNFWKPPNPKQQQMLRKKWQLLLLWCTCLTPRGVPQTSWRFTGFWTISTENRSKYHIDWVNCPDLIIFRIRWLT